VVAAVDVDETRVREFTSQFGIAAAYTDAAEMLEKEKPQLVHICTPPGTHCELSSAAMQAGAWVLCEKPITASLAELDRLAEVEQRTGKFVSSVFQMRFGSAAVHLRKLMAEN